MYATATVPGTLQNGTVLPESASRFSKCGIALRNVGEFSLAVAGIDAAGNLIKPHVFLMRGERLAGVVLPANSVRIIVVGQKAENENPPISGVAVLGYGDGNRCVS